MKGSFAEKTEMASPQFLIIDGTGDDPNGSGVYLYRFDANGDCLTDTWHVSVDDAKAQAAYEYENFVHGWQEIPAEIEDIGEYGSARVKRIEEFKLIELELNKVLREISGTVSSSDAGIWGHTPNSKLLKRRRLLCVSARLRPSFPGGDWHLPKAA